MLTRRNALIFLAAFSLVAGFGAGRPAVAAMGAFVIALLIAQYASAADLLSGIRVTRTHTPRAFQEEEVGVTLDVHNDGVRPLYLLTLWDSFAPSGAYRIGQLAPALPADNQVR